MESNILKAIGLGNIDIGIILIVLLIIAMIIIIVNSVKISKLTKKYAHFMKGKEVKSLETEVFRMFDENEQMKTDIKQNIKDIRAIYKQLETTYQKMGLVKYDAFDQMGGKLSFCLTMLDEHNNGFMLNSMHNTDGTYSYIKSIKEGKCKLDLSNEEKAALNKAIHGDMNINEAG